VILVPRAVRVYFATEPTNLRMSFDGLSNAIRHALGYDPLGGHVFVFVNRRRNQVKLIVWTRGGFWNNHEMKVSSVDCSKHPSYQRLYQDGYTTFLDHRKLAQFH
jgi:transposase